MNANWRIVATIGAMLAATANGLAHAGGPAVVSVRGHAVFTQQSGVPDGGNFTNQVSINAWLNEDGSADGVMEWTWQQHTVPGGGGQLASGYPWTIAIDTLIVIDATHVYVEGTVVNSPQNPSDVGIRQGVYITDNGNGRDDPPDEWYGAPIDAGNLTID